MLTPEDQAEVLRLVAPLLERTLTNAVGIARDSTPRSAWRPGTVQGVNTTTDVATVLVDGDTVAIDALCLGEWPAVFDRVMVIFAPPSACFCIPFPVRATTELPVGLVGLAERETDLLGYTGGDILTANFTSVGNRYYKVTVSMYGANQAGAGSWEGYVQDLTSTNIGRFIISRAAGATPYPVTYSFVYTPAAGATGVKVNLFRSGGTPTIDIYAAAPYPFSIIIEDAGPV